VQHLHVTCLNSAPALAEAPPPSPPAAAAAAAAEEHLSDTVHEVSIGALHGPQRGAHATNNVYLSFRSAHVIS